MAARPSLVFVLATTNPLPWARRRAPGLKSLALGAYPGSGPGARRRRQPERGLPDQPLGGLPTSQRHDALAAHYRAHDEVGRADSIATRAGNQEIRSRNPLPPAALALRDFQVNGHRVTFDGELTMAFRLDDRGSLVAFAGSNCRSMTIDGREFVVCQQARFLAAWAPVLPQRRVPGGAILEVWIHGEADITLPLPGAPDGGALYFQGARIDMPLERRVPCECSGGVLRFKSRNDWPRAASLLRRRVKHHCCESKV